jgi:hypothetical protein
VIYVLVGEGRVLVACAVVGMWVKEKKKKNISGV